MENHWLNKWVLVLLLFSAFNFGCNQQILLVESLSCIKENDPTPQAAVSANLGAWIIIAGDRSDHDKQTQIKFGCNQVYDYLIALGYSASNIYYLGPEVGAAQPHVNNESNIANIQWAITQWAATKVNSVNGLGMYLFDHGGVGVMCIPGSFDLSETNLNSYLDTLESSTGANRIIIIYEACHAGSFINPVSKSNRIIITATDSDHSSSVNPDGTWATFSEGFWSSIITSHTLGHAFEDAEAFVEATGHGATQIPWIDDDHNEVGHTTSASGTLPNGGDGSDALIVSIGTTLLWHPPYIAIIPLWFFIPTNKILVPISAVINYVTPIEKVYVRIIPPGWVPPDPEIDKEGTKLVEDGLPLILLEDKIGDHNFTGVIDRRLWSNYLSAEGTYQLMFMAKGQDGIISPPESTKMGINKYGTTPPDQTPPTVEILDLYSQMTVKGLINVTARASDDQALDKVQILLDSSLLKEEVMPGYLPYPDVTYALDTKRYSEGDHNLTAIAIDKAGLRAQVSITLRIQNESGPGIPGYPSISLMICSLIGIIVLLKRSKKNA